MYSEPQRLDINFWGSRHFDALSFSLFRQDLLESLYQYVRHYLHPVVVGVQGRVVAPVVELSLTACLGKEVCHGERLIGCYLTDDVGIFLKVDTVQRVVPMGRQVIAVSVSLAWCAEDDAGLFVSREDAVDDLPVDGGKGSVLLVFDVVVDGADGRGVSPVVDAVLYGVEVCKGNCTDCRRESPAIDGLVLELREVRRVICKVLSSWRKNVTTKFLHR